MNVLNTVHKYVLYKILVSFSALIIIILLYLFNWGNSLPFLFLKIELCFLFFFFFQEFLFVCLFQLHSSLPVYYAMEIFYSFSFSILLLDITCGDFHFIFQKIFRKNVRNFFSDILFYWYFLKINFRLITSYSLLFWPFSSCGFQITLSVFFSSWTDSMLSSLFILSFSFCSLPFLSCLFLCFFY